jgi:hypothetical protein
VGVRRFFRDLFPVRSADQLREDLFFLAYASNGGLNASWIEEQTREDITWFKRRLSKQLDDEAEAIRKARKKK